MHVCRTIDPALPASLALLRVLLLGRAAVVHLDLPFGQRLQQVSRNGVVQSVDIELLEQNKLCCDQLQRDLKVGKKPNETQTTEL